MPEITRNSCCDWWKTGRFLLHNGFLLRNMLIGGVKARTWGSIRAPRWKNLYSLQGLWSNQFRMDERVNWSGKGFASVGRILFFLDRVLDCLTNRLYIFFLTIFIANYSTNYCLIGLFINRFIKFLDFDIINVIF